MRLEFYITWLASKSDSIQFNLMPKDFSSRNYSFLPFPQNAVALCWIRLYFVRSVSQANMQTLLSRGERRVLPDGTTVMSACLSSSLSVLAWSACLSAWFPLYLLFCSTVNLSLCLSDCQPVFSIWPTLSHITNNHCHSRPPPPLHRQSPPPWVPFRICFFQFHCTLFFHVFRGIETLGSPSSYQSTGSLRPTSRGPDRGCLLSCYLSPS